MWRFFFIFVIMSGKKISKETAIKSMLADLKRGVDKPTILGKFGKKWEIPKSTYYRWYDEAEKKHQPYLKKIQEVENQTIERVVSEMVTSNILSKIERQQILSDIALGKIPLVKHIVVNRMIEEVEVVPNWSDRKSAIDILNKMDGAYFKEEPEDEEEFNGFEIQDV